MPELPEVETMCRGIRPIVGGTIVDAVRTPCRARPITIRPRIDRLRGQLAGQRLVGVRRLGKRVVIQVQGDRALVIEPRMTGLVLIDQPPDAVHLRFRLALAGAAVDQLLFWDRRGLGSVQLWTARRLDRLVERGLLGPDALDIDPAALVERLGRSARPIKVALMDQRRIAGIGNLYASEILHVAGIHPATACSRLSRSAWQRLHEAVGRVLSAAIQSEGSTLSDGTYRNALNRQGSFQNEHRVYDRSGRRCPSCHRATVQRIVQAQRSTFYCPRCQRRR